MRRKRSRAWGCRTGSTIELQDYTRIEGEFDKIASIGMFEHVGIANHPAYFDNHPSPAASRAACTSTTPSPVAPRHEKGFRKRKREYSALGALHIPRRRARSPRHVRRQSGALRFRGARRGRPGASITPAPPGCGTNACNANRDEAEARGRAGEDAAVAALSRRLLARLRAQHGGHLPDARVQARARAVRPAADAGGSVPALRHRAARP